VSTIDTLPSTGAGAESGGSSWLSAALAGGAVAAVARWMKRSDEAADES
jgi:LPXTG-motif cell wall-anchored protein